MAPENGKKEIGWWVVAESNGAKTAGENNAKTYGTTCVQRKPEKNAAEAKAHQTKNKAVSRQRSSSGDADQPDGWALIGCTHEFYDDEMSAQQQWHAWDPLWCGVEVCDHQLPVGQFEWHRPFVSCTFLSCGIVNY